MNYDTIIIFKDNIVFACVNILSKENQKGRILYNYIDVSDVKGHKPGDVVSIADNKDDFFNDIVLTSKICTIEERANNLKEAYFQVLNNYDAEPYDCDNHPRVTKVHDLPYSENTLFRRSIGILMEWIKIQKNNLPSKDVKNIKVIIKQAISIDIQNVIGMPPSGFYSCNINDEYAAFEFIKEKYKLKDYVEVKQIIHANCLNYLREIGEKIFAFEKNK